METNEILNILLKGKIHNFKNNIRFRPNLKENVFSMYVDKVKENTFPLSKTGLMEALEYKERVFDSLTNP